MSAYQVSEQMSVKSLPKVQSVMPPNMGIHQLSSKNKRKSWTEKLPKVQGISFANQVSSSTSNKSSHGEPFSKVQNESFESVRSKLRESLSAALVFVSGEVNKTQETLSTEETRTQGRLIASGPVGELNSTKGNTFLHPMSATLWGSMTSKADGDDVILKHDGSCGLTGDAFINEHPGDSTKGFDKKHIPLRDMPSNDNFLLKDELLQENGLCWASGISIENSGLNDGVDPKRPDFGQDEVTRYAKEQADRAHILAANIEAVLFRLFGGVNKKYKERGRSLLFNLKDPNNPELRERVFSGEITPERLCSMTAEELASKQLTEWRIAKAEELAQMVVLPDSDVDLRRLVKKTHKGELQVEVERDDSVLVEVTLGANAPEQFPTRTPERKNCLKSAIGGAQKSTRPSETGGGLSQKVASDIRDLSNLNTVPQPKPEFMVDEQDAECLPPIASFDELMESLDSEPQFKNVSMDAEQHTLPGGKNLNRADGNLDSMSTGSEHELNATSVILGKKMGLMNDDFAAKLDHLSDSLVSKVDRVNAGSADPLDMSEYQLGETDSKHEDKNLGHILGFGAVHIELDKSSMKIASGGEQIWEGLVQLNSSSSVTFLAFFRSGEKASTKEWPRLVEVKGRVRVDAFEKFLQELPLSRSRTIMVVHFLRKEGSPGSGRAMLTKAVESYVAEDRLGYAEPAPGVELYLCPPHMKTTIQMLGSFIHEEDSQAPASTVDGLIGVVVWRRAHVISTASPRLSSHQKHSSSSKRHSMSRKPQPRNDNLSSQPFIPAHVGNPEPQVEEDVVDVPPGFGPDDLPEFSFQGGSLPATTNIPQIVGTSEACFRGRALAPRAEHMRELIHKYGHGGAAGISPAGHTHPPMQSWDDDDDDDDIPEWQPHKDKQPRRATATAQSIPLQGFQPQRVKPHLANEAPLPFAMPSQISMAQGSHSVQPMACWAGESAHVGFSANGVQRPWHHYGGGRPLEGQCHGRGGFGGDLNTVMNRRYVPRGSGV